MTASIPLGEDAQRALLQAARDARSNAYAPYSKFKVGAAVRGASGAIYHGCNVENVAYPEGTCAEAGAIALMVASVVTCVSAHRPRHGAAHAQDQHA